jgi:hypothetical protein
MYARVCMHFLYFLAQGTQSRLPIDAQVTLAPASSPASRPSLCVTRLSVSQLPANFDGLASAFVCM